MARDTLISLSLQDIVKTLNTAICSAARAEQIAVSVTPLAELAG